MKYEKSMAEVVVLDNTDVITTSDITLCNGGKNNVKPCNGSKDSARPASASLEEEFGIGF